MQISIFEVTGTCPQPGGFLRLDQTKLCQQPISRYRLLLSKKKCHKFVYSPMSSDKSRHSEAEKRRNHDFRGSEGRVPVLFEKRAFHDYLFRTPEEKGND